ncbi:uncharacterized protein N7479_010601 [Penicillium vulpinum]|nr:uncharacterized protein N7479_010601 [Penicillium vulpinum]KAJ5952188.1 hypothetical protein N7479_010601 [Penicillium vulpinum]
MFRRGLRALSKSAEAVPLGNKENLPSGNKESSPPGNKEHTPQSTPNVGQPPSSLHPIKIWLKNVARPVDGSPINRVRPEVDNINFHIKFSESSESGSPPAWFNETWDKDPEIRRFLCKDEIPHDQVHQGFRATHHTPRYEPHTIINPRPYPSAPATPVLSQPAAAASKLDHSKEPASSPSLNTTPDTIAQFTEQGQMATSAQKRAFLTDDTEPQYPAKRVKVELDEYLEDTNVSEDDNWDSDPPTSPEYKISSTSDSDVSDFPSSPCVRRVKKASLHSSVKNGRSLKTKGKARKARKRKWSDSDRSMSEPSDLDYESEEEYFIPRGERDDELLNTNLTRERAKRLLEAMELPQGHDLSPDEQRTAHQLLTRGCMPAIHRHWEKDFSTLPESLFFSGKDDETELKESNFVLGNDKCSEFYAIRAFQETLKICGNVRDYCNILEISPEIYIKKSVEKYLRWALSDAGVRVQPDTPPVHVIYCKNQDEMSKEAFSKVATALQKLSDTWQSQLTAPHDGEKVWPALIGLVLCGPVLSAISLDTNPNPQTLTRGIKFLGHFDLADFDSDVWNTLAVAIIVMHIRRTVNKLGKAYGNKFVASVFDDPAMSSSDADL